MNFTHIDARNRRSRGDNRLVRMEHDRNRRCRKELAATPPSHRRRVAHVERQHDFLHDAVGLDQDFHDALVMADVVIAVRPTENSEGTPITRSAEQLASFWQWFGRSIVVDEAGRPRVVYRGEHGRNDHCGRFQSRRGSLSFGSADAAKIYSSVPHDRLIDPVTKSPRIFAAYLRIEQPLISDPTDPFIELGKLGEILGGEPLREIASEFAEDITYTSHWLENFEQFSKPQQVADIAPERFNDLYFASYTILDSLKWVEQIKSLGFDGAIHCGSGVTAFEPEYKVFADDQTWIISRQIIDAR